MKNFSTKDMVFTALFAAIFCILAPFSIPIGEVPVSVTNFLIYIKFTL
jgi:biotin transport system substrate-specific component